MTDIVSLVQSGGFGYLVILIAGVLMTEPWRWAGVRLSRDLDIDSEIFRWVRAVSTALVAGLVARLVIFPIGQLENIPLSIRIIAFTGGLLIYLMGVRNLAVGVISGTIILIAGAWLLAV